MGELTVPHESQLMFPTVLWARLVANGICNGDRSIDGLLCSYSNVVIDILS